MVSKLATTTAHLHTLISRGGSSDRGLQRERNEDAFALPSAGAEEARLGTLLVVADGVGGLPGGAAASWDAVHYLQALYYAGAGPDHPGDRLRRCVEMVNLLNRAAQQRLGQIGERLTTLVAAVVYNDYIWIANVGDSRAYLVQANATWRQLTEDHSVTRTDQAGDPDQPRRRTGAITRAIGLEKRCQVDVYRYQWQPGDRLILCSDGLARLAIPAMAQTALHYPPQAAAEALIAQANKEDGSDNSTVVVASWENSPAPEVAQEKVRFQPQQSRSIWKSLVIFIMGLILGGVSTMVYWLYF